MNHGTPLPAIKEGLFQRYLRIPVIPEAALVGALSALLRPSQQHRGPPSDPSLPFKTARVNGRSGEKSVFGRDEEIVLQRVAVFLESYREGRGSLNSSAAATVRIAKGSAVMPNCA
jgi:hypothetical protein